MRILLVEDDELTAEVLTIVLSNQHYAVEVAKDGQAGLELVEAFAYDLILLDVMLPKLDGISLCKRIRSQGYQMPILLLTGRDSTHDKAIGLDAGADDYVVKPFEQEELVARVRALLRRGGSTSLPVLEWGSLRLDPSSCEVTYGTRSLHLTAKEYSLLELFLRNSRRVFSCSAILEHVWSFEKTPGEDAVRTQIKGLRQKLKAAGASADLIETVYGIGYRLKPLEKGAGSREQGAEGDGENCTPSPPHPLTPSDVEQETLAELAGVWNQLKSRVSEQVAILEQAAEAELKKALSEELRLRAEQEAHTLAGSLGTFGFSSGSRLARKIEHLFQTGKSLSQSEAISLSEQVGALRQEIEGTPEELALVAETNKDERPLLSVVDERSDWVPGAATQVLEHPDPTIAKVMVVDDDPQILAILRMLLEPWGLVVITLDDPRRFWETLEAIDPDLLILDIKMPHLSGIEVCQLVRNDTRWSGLPILFLTAYTNAAVVNQVFAVGADDFVSKPIVGPELVTRIINRLERIKLLQSLAGTDPLTKVSNRHKSTEELDKLLSLAKRHNQPLCLALLDLDQFKRVNDAFGHATGNAVLRHLGQLLMRIRREDVVARWGGEEFVLGMYGMTRLDGVHKLQEMLETLRQQEFIAPNSTKFRVTFSAGVAQYPEDGADLESLYRSCVAALYQAKATGRDRVLPAGAPPHLLPSSLNKN